MALIDNMITLRDRLEAIPFNLGVPTYKPVTIVRTDGLIEVTPVPRVISAASPGTSIPGGTQLGIPGSLVYSNIHLKTNTALVYISRSYNLATIFSEEVLYYQIENIRYDPITIGQNDLTIYEIMVQQKYDIRS